MTVCNYCGGTMLPDLTALVPALGCQECGRLIPLPGARARSRVRGDKAELNRMMRAARRRKIGRR